MEFLVADAERNLESKLNHWVYKIVCSVSLVSYQAPPLFPRINSSAPPNYAQEGNAHVFRVTHRYSDFEWLSEQLRVHFPGSVIPAIPDKDADGTLDKVSGIMKNPETEAARDSPITKKRIRHMQLFLNCLATQTDLLESEFVKAFCSMEEPEWHQFKEEVLKRNGSLGDRLFSKGKSFFSKLADKKVVAFPPGSKWGDIKQTYTELSAALVAASKTLHVTETNALQVSDIARSIQEMNAEDANKPLVLPVLFNNHLVCDHAQPEIIGSIRHIQGSTLWVEFKDKINRFDIDSLRTPCHGMSDPILVTSDLFANQVDTYLSYCHLNNAAKGIQNAVDLCWFWGRMCLSLISTIDHCATIEQDRFNAEHDSGKTSDPKKKADLAEKAAQLQTKFDEACKTMDVQYAEWFRPLLCKNLAEISKTMALASTQILTDDEWETRLENANKTLKLQFDVPKTVQDDIDSIVAAARTQAAAQPERDSSQDAVPMIPAAVPVAHVKSPPPQPVPQHARQPSMGQEHKPEVGLDAPPPTPPVTTAPEAPTAVPDANSVTSPTEAPTEAQMDNDWQSSPPKAYEEPNHALNDDVPPPVPGDHV